MTGILCIDKPGGFTSFDVVAKLRGMTREKRVGHSGTLDPMATGVLPLFFGRATKAVDLLPDQDKRYTATFRLGIATDTQDITGRVLSERPVRVSAAEVREGLSAFLGPQMQTPPMYSAVQVGGRRLYDIARQGLEVERPGREVLIHRLDLLQADEREHLYTVDVACSKGTYLRTLCHDLGERLGCGAVLTALRRTMACGFGLGGCITLQEAQRLTDGGALSGRLLPVEAAFASLPRLVLEGRQAHLFRNGVRLPLSELQIPEGEAALRVLDGAGRFLGIARPDPGVGVLRLIKLFVLEDKA